MAAEARRAAKSEEQTERVCVYMSVSECVDQNRGTDETEKEAKEKDRQTAHSRQKSKRASSCLCHSF
jgi:hypothetical protein